MDTPSVCAKRRPKKVPPASPFSLVPFVGMPPRSVGYVQRAACSWFRLFCSWHLVGILRRRMLSKLIFFHAECSQHISGAAGYSVSNSM